MLQPRPVPLALLAALSAPAWAASHTVTLDVPGMTCPVCPVTVKAALDKVSGVQKVQVNYAARKVLVTYDDTKTDPATLTRTTADAGYPSHLERP